ncbi:MAG: hypothetical protein NT154_04590 [Verrucomicrobia bacterium]|nr:hypothetical protein [Verrucomicrobiota bacterium]
MLLTDPSGRRVGFDPVTGTVVNEVGEAAVYSGPGTEPQEVHLLSDGILPGEYHVSGIGTGTGQFVAEVEIEGQEDDSVADVKKVIALGSVQEGDALVGIPAVDVYRSSIALRIEQEEQTVRLLPPFWLTNGVCEASTTLAPGSWGEIGTITDPIQGLTITNIFEQARFFRLRVP